MARAFDDDDEDETGQRDVLQALSHSQTPVGQSKFVLLPFLVPVPVFKMLESHANKLGITVANLVTKSLQEKVERLEKEQGR